MPAPKGNHNAAKGKRWQDALHKALTRFQTDDGAIKAGEALDKIAETVVKLALMGEKDAWQEIGNRLDGKPHQSMDVAYTELPAEELDDAELQRIASRGRNGAAKAKGGAAKPPEVH